MTAGPDVRGAAAELLIWVCICNDDWRLFLMFGDWCKFPVMPPGIPPRNLLLDYCVSKSPLGAFGCTWFPARARGFGPLTDKFCPIPLAPRMGLTLPG